MFSTTASGVATTLAGASDGYADGTGIVAMFSNPTGVAASPNGEVVYVADNSNSRIRSVTSELSLLLIVVSSSSSSSSISIL